MYIITTESESIEPLLTLDPVMGSSVNSESQVKKSLLNQNTRTESSTNQTPCKKLSSNQNPGIESSLNPNPGL